MMSLRVTRQGTGFRAYVGKLQKCEVEAPKEVADYVADEWKAGVRVDTGSLRAGIYVSSDEGSGYSEAVSRAKALNPTVEIREEVRRPGRKGAAAVGSVAGHDVYNEYGTSKMPAHPAFRQAVEKGRKRFPDLVKKKLAV